MIITETYENNPDLVRRYSDAGFMIRQVETGDMYGEAIDLIATPITYEEADIPIEPDEGISDTDAMNIIFGGEYE